MVLKADVFRTLGACNAVRWARLTGVENAMEVPCLQGSNTMVSHCTMPPDAIPLSVLVCSSWSRLHRKSCRKQGWWFCWNPTKLWRTIPNDLLSAADLEDISSRILHTILAELPDRGDNVSVVLRRQACGETAMQWDYLRWKDPTQSNCKHLEVVVTEYAHYHPSPQSLLRVRNLALHRYHQADPVHRCCR